MNRKAFLLGFFSIGGQVLLLRELVASFNGDELFIGTALFGWMLAVASGAGFGGRKKTGIKTAVLFTIGIILLPATVIIARLSPLLVTDTPGEVIRFSVAAVLSIIIMIPVGIISGWLFSAITREGYRPAKLIVRVYLFEGIGSFIGGVMIAALVGQIFSTLAMSMALSVIVIGLYWLPDKKPQVYLMPGLIVVLLIAIRFVIPSFDSYLDSIKYRSFDVEQSFDTHYGRQTILSRNESIILLTDNTVEAIYPDLMRAENILLPPILYKPGECDILYIGRAEFGVMQLADSLDNVRLSTLDPRKTLSAEIDKYIYPSNRLNRINDDQLAYFIRRRALSKYDIIILHPGDPDSHKNGRLLTSEFLNQTKSMLKKDGILFYSSPYDSDRYISPEKKTLLALINNTLGRAFDYVRFWPGENTFFFASDDTLINIPPETVIARTGTLKYRPQYINDIYLADRFGEIKTARLENALDISDQVNIRDKPVLPYYQSIFRSSADGLDRTLIPFVFKHQLIILVLPVLVVALMLFLVLQRKRRRSFGLFLYFVAGIVSLSLELLVFYVYQSTSGSLYSEMAVLIGTFMFGLAVGTYYSFQIDKENLEYPALLLLLTSMVVYYATHDKIGSASVLIYHICFLFTVAVATGSLFVAATDRCYYGRSQSNRGVGYAIEIVGSSIGALTAVTILLPLLGLQWLLISFIILVLITLVGAILTA